MEVSVGRYRVSLPDPADLPGEIKEAHLPWLDDESLAVRASILRPVQQGGRALCYSRRWTDLRRPGFFERAFIGVPAFHLGEVAAVATVHPYFENPSEADVLAQIPEKYYGQVDAYQWFAPTTEQLQEQLEFRTATNLYVAAAVLYR